MAIVEDHSARVKFRGQLSRLPIFRVTHLVLTSSPMSAFEYPPPVPALNVDLNLGDRKMLISND